MPKKVVDQLNELKIRQAKPAVKDGSPVDRRLYDGRGMYLLIKANGAKHWRLKYRFDGKEKLLALGEYPDTSLVSARQKAGDARVLVRDGIDPVQAGREAKNKKLNEARQTFAVVAEEWITKKGAKWSEVHLSRNKQHLRDYVLPKVGNRPISALTTMDVMQVLEPLEKAQKLEILRKVRQQLSAVMAHAVQTGRRGDNPVRETQGAFETHTRDHFASISQTDLPEFLKRLDLYQGHRNTVAIIRMILWTGSRTGELRSASAAEFDLDGALWRIPADKMKKRRPHVVPLPAQAVTLLRDLLPLNKGSDYAFPSQYSTSKASENIVLQALDKMGYGGKLTGHGLRAAVATGLEELGFPIEIIKVQLSHSKGNLTDQAYLRGIHIERRAEMMQQWANGLDAATAGAKVCPINRGAKHG